MGRPKKYDKFDIYAGQRAYLKTSKGKEAKKRYNTTEAARASKRKWKRKHDGTIVDKRQWFIDTYGDIEKALQLLNDRETDVITKIFGLNGSPPLKQKDLAAQWDKSPQWISEIKKEALKKLLPLQQEPQSTDEKKV